MIYHLDTTFLIDWHRRDARIASLREEIIAGATLISSDKGIVRVFPVAILQY